MQDKDNPEMVLCKPADLLLLSAGLPPRQALSQHDYTTLSAKGIGTGYAVYNFYFCSVFTDVFVIGKF